MIIRFSNNILDRITGITYYNRVNLTIFVLINALICYLYIEQDMYDLQISVIPVTILGGALAIFLAFRNNSAYDRWWEARKIWGGIVNSSRTLSAKLHSLLNDKSKVKPYVERHIAYLYILANQLRKLDFSEYGSKYLSAEDKAAVENNTNSANL